MNSRLLLQNRHQKIHTIKIRTNCCSSRNSKITLTHQSLDLHQNRSRPLHRTCNNRPRSILRSSIQKELRRILHFFKSGILHLKNTNFIGRTKTIFHRTQDPVRSMPVSLKVKHSIYHMFQYTRTCHISLLGHMTHDKNGHSHTLSDLHQYIGRFPHLRNTSRCRRNIFMKHRLDRIHNSYIWFRPLNDLPDIFKIRLTEQFQFIIKRSKPICPELDLSERLLTRNIQNRNPL